MKTIICSIGGGYSSTVKMPEFLIKNYPKEQLHFVNCVLPNEHKSTWQLIDSVSEKLGFDVTYIAFDPNSEKKYRLVSKEDRSNTDILYTPFDVFDLVDFIGNSRVGKCSIYLKRQTILNYVRHNYPSKDCIMAVGIHSDELDRIVQIRQNWTKSGYETMFPIESLPRETREKEIEYIMGEYGVDMELYRLGFEHNNCGGACVKAGQRQWAMLLTYLPDVYHDWESREQQWIKNHDGKSYPFLKKVVDGKSTYITLEEFREHIETSIANQDENFITRFIDKLSSNPACMWCSAI